MIPVVIAQIILGGTFIFSGVVKCIDPLGTSIKLGEYFQLFGWRFLMEWTDIFAVLLALVEFWIGFNVLFGRNRSLVMTLCGIVMFGFTGFTLYLALANPISDCGCFGDAVVFSNWETFWKNVILLVCYLILLLLRKHYKRLFPNRLNVFSYSLYGYLGIGLCLWLCWVGINRLPILDFRPFKSGVDIAQAMGIASSTSFEEVEYRFIYEKEGERKEFTLENLPTEEGWIPVDRIEVPVSDGASPMKLPSIKDFFVIDESGADITEELLADTTYHFLLLSPSLGNASEHDIDKIESLYEYAIENDYKFHALTVRDQEQIDYWIFRSGAEYPMLYSDATIIETIIRANPGLMLIKEGVIYWKKSLPQIDVRELTSDKLNVQTYGQIEIIDVKKRISFLIVLFFAPLLIFLYFGNKIYKLNINKKKMRKKIVAGNWKMNTTLQEGLALAKELDEALKGKEVKCDVVICTPYISIASICAAIDTEKIGVGAENCADHTSGAYTGEISADMVASTGAKYVILGHSERRQYYGETNEILTTKVNLALAAGLTPIFCVGEVKEERENGTFKEVIESQMKAIYGLSAEDFAKVVIAYEPVWAIGTGLTATSEQAQEVHADIRKSIEAVYGAEIADNTSILYGGSCKGSNAPELFSQPDIDGGLIGGAALKVDTFMPIIEAWK